MSRLRTAVGALLLALVAAGGEAVRVLPPARDGALGVALPPLARVLTAAPDGQMWRQTGELGGSLASARGDFMMALGAQGWALKQTIAMGRSAARSELMVWTWHRRRILFMVWEKEAGTCGFAWGEEK